MGNTVAANATIFNHIHGSFPGHQRIRTRRRDRQLRARCRALGYVGIGGVPAGERARVPPQFAAAQSHHASHVAHRERPRVLRALRAAALRSGGSRAVSRRRHRAAARHAATDLWNDLRRASPGRRGRRVPRALSGNATRRRAFRSRPPTSSTRASTRRCASARSAARTWRGRRVGTTRMVCCAAPAYLARHGEPKTPEALAGHACLTYEYLPHKNVWPFRGADGGDRSVRVAGPVHANHGNFLATIAVAGRASCSSRISWWAPTFVQDDSRRSSRVPAASVTSTWRTPAADISRQGSRAAEFLSARFAVPARSLNSPPPTPATRKRKAPARAS